jgi:PAS domain S-box-containing protein
MSDSDYNRSAGMLLIHRNIWLFTLIGVAVVLFAWVFMMVDENMNLQPVRLIHQHRDFPFLFIFDLFPLCMLVVLLMAKKNFVRERKKRHRELLKLSETFNQSEQYARALSQGEDPEEYAGMLDNELGQALKLIHLNIRSNRRKEKEITWITEGKDMISRIMRVHDQVDELSYQILKSLSKYIGAIQGAMYIYTEEKKQLVSAAVLAYNRRKYLDQRFNIGEGLVGQCGFEMDFIYRTEIPDDYVTITSGLLGDQKPRSIVLVPLITNEALQGVLEFAFLDARITKLKIQFLLELGEIIARTLFNLRVNETTRQLLEESRTMTNELKKNEQILQENAREMKSTQNQLQETNVQLQNKIEEAQHATNRLYRLLENASEIISIYDTDTQLTYISPSVTHILGYTPEEMMAGKDFERVDQKSSNEMLRAFETLRNRPEEVIYIEYAFLRKDGHRTYLQSTIKNRLSDPSISGFVLNTRDVSESRLIEKEQRLKTRMQSLSENSLDLILRVGVEGRVHYANPVVEDYTGILPDSIINMTVDEIPFRKDMKEVIGGAVDRIRNKPVKFSLENTIDVLLGEKLSERILHFDVIPEFQEGELETILLVGHDITEAKRIESEIKITNRKMQDSIQYAERIQSSLLPGVPDIKKAFPKSFIYYEPRDVISGDFPWLFETKDAWFISAIDCTGHGVPGALLSFIGFFLLNNITALHPELSPGTICDMLSKEVRKTLKQNKQKPETRDGMDLALLKIRKDGEALEFAGAHRPLYLLRTGELAVYKGDRKAIGGFLHPRISEQDFTNHRVPLRKGDKVFFFSDGLTDQLGGPDGRKYGAARIREFLVENPGYTLQQMHEHVRSDWHQWKGEQKQLDDVLMIGIEF